MAQLYGYVRIQIYFKINIFLYMAFFFYLLQNMLKRKKSKKK